jgi:MFS family permease
MYAFFWFIFIVIVAANIGLQYYLRQGSGSQSKQGSSNAEFKAFQQNYFIVYWVVMFSDWLQGPYTYALYEHYGFSLSEIATLFIIGFGASLVFGTITGALADKYGRKRMCMAFGIIYAMSCLLKAFNSFNALLFARILAGIATSLLYSVFEAWMVTEHKRRNFPDEWLSDTFGTATFGNGLAAILAGLIASALAAQFGYVAPFMLAMVCLLGITYVINNNWNENYGDAQLEVIKTFQHAFEEVQKDRKVMLVGLIQSLFEAAMYTFVFMWTPTLSASAPEFREKNSALHGLVFASYMTCVMLGSSLFGLLKPKNSEERIGQILIIAAIGAMMLPVLFAGTSAGELILLGFLVFETTVGLYFPTLGTLRGKYIPADSRAAIMSFYRVPLNFIVVFTLIFSDSFDLRTVFIICVLELAGALYCQMQLAKHRTEGPADELPVIIEQTHEEDGVEM